MQLPRPRLRKRIKKNDRGHIPDNITMAIAQDEAVHKTAAIAKHSCFSLGFVLLFAG